MYVCTYNHIHMNRMEDDKLFDMSQEILFQETLDQNFSHLSKTIILKLGIC